jgi:hypothetical protein
MCPKNVLEDIGEGFLQIQPSVVSAALLDNDDLDELHPQEVNCQTILSNGFFCFCLHILCS